MKFLSLHTVRRGTACSLRPHQIIISDERNCQCCQTRGHKGGFIPQEDAHRKLEGAGHIYSHAPENTTRETKQILPLYENSLKGEVVKRVLHTEAVIGGMESGECVGGKQGRC